MPNIIPILLSMVMLLLGIGVIRSWFKCLRHDPGSAFHPIPILLFLAPGLIMAIVGLCGMFADWNNK